MSNIVTKFGGVSVCTAESIQAVSEIIKSNANIKFVVVSAVKDITSKLMQFCNSYISMNDTNSSITRDLDTEDRLNMHDSTNTKLAKHAISKADTTTGLVVSEAELCKRSIIYDIENIHIDLAHNLGLLEDYTIKDDIITHINKCTKILSDHTLNTKPNNETVNKILAIGEDLSCIIIYHFLNKNGINTTYVNARDIVITNSENEPNVAEIKKRLEEVLSITNNLIITQGFIGSYNGVTTTLGRGGSDYSAALIAEGIQASELLIYKDVMGVYTADPKLIKGAKLIETLSFSEMATIANLGAKVIHPAAIQPCLRGNIPIRIISTLDPSSTGTSIRSDNNCNKFKTEHYKKNSSLCDNFAKAVTIRKNQLLIGVKCVNMPKKSDKFLSLVLSAFPKQEININFITTNELILNIDCTNISYAKIFENQHFVKELGNFTEIAIESGLTSIAIIGRNATTIDSINKICKELNIKLIHISTKNDYSASILVKNEYAIEAANALHKMLIS